MRRAERLFQIVQLIRGRRLSTAQYLAERLSISTRSIYRDIADLQLQGVPIEGEAGVGYRMGAGFELPPLMFSRAEAQAIVAALRMASAYLGPKLQRGCEDASAKIISQLPKELRNAVESLPLYAPSFDFGEKGLAYLDILQSAISARRKVQITYCDLAGNTSQRQLRPLACLYWGKLWTLAAWCEQREDFRSFRLDRISQLSLLDIHFRDELDKSLATLMRREEDACQTATHNQTKSHN